MGGAELGGPFKWQKADLRLAIEVGPAVVPGVVLSSILARRVVVISEHRRRAWRCRAKPALQNVLIAGLAMASLPAIVFFHPRAVPNQMGGWRPRTCSRLSGVTATPRRPAPELR